MSLLVKDIKSLNNLTKALAWAERKLSAAGIVATAHLDALVLLEDVTKVDRARILSHPELPLSEALVRKYVRQVNQRAKHLPLAYIRGKTEFFGREFKINKHVLEPRPESEALIVEFNLIASSVQAIDTVIDVGTGSGALIITAKLERPWVKALALDVSSKCLSVASENAASYHQDISYYLGDLLDPLPKQTWSAKSEVILLANLPYVPDNWQINLAAASEPAIAIFGGPDGLNLYRKLFKQIASLKHPPKWVLTESMPPQQQALAKIAAASGYSLVNTNDFVQVFAI